MKEDYLHFLWRMRFLPSRIFELEDGSKIEIIEFGEHNKNESGPDFFHARIILNGTLLFGHIEFHLKGSDWYKHKHQFDPAYENVVLHVVWENDQPVFIRERELPVLCLSKYIENDFSKSHQSDVINQKSLPCQYALDEVDDIYIEKEKESAVVHRMKRKTERFMQDSNISFAQVLYELIATAFGAKINRDPFWQLTREIPIVRILKMSQKKRSKLLIAASGVFADESSGLSSMHKSQWKKKGLHPKGAPEIRVGQFAEFIAHFNFDFGFLDITPDELVKYIRNSFKLAENTQVSYSKNFQDLIIINAFAPFLWWIGEYRGDSVLQTKAFDVLERLSSEQNHLIKFLKKSGFSITSAYDSQSLLELYSLRCSRKKCLTCGIGNQILGQ